MKKANFFFFLTLLHTPTHPYPSSLSASCLHPSLPYSDPPSFFLTLSPESLSYSPSSPPYHLPTISLHPPYILPTSSLPPPCYLSASSLLPFWGNASRCRYIVHDLSSRSLPTASTSTPPFLRVFSDFSRTILGGTSEGPRRNLGVDVFLVLVISVLDA